MFHNFGHIDGGHEGLFRQQHGFFRRAADADAQNARRTPAGAHGGQGLGDPVGKIVAWVQHCKFGLVFRSASFGGDRDFNCLPGDNLSVDDRRGVVARILAVAYRRRDH